MNLEKVMAIEHYTDDLFWFRTTKSDAWEKKNFQPGEFTMIGMGDKLSPNRAYSIANSPEDDYLEFLSIKVEDGPLTSRLQNIAVGDEIEVSPKAIGTLLLRNLEPEPCINGNGRLWMISTGTGLAPFLSLARHPEVYEYYEEVIVTHTCRTNAELVFRRELEQAGAKVYQTVTREAPAEGVYKGRITDNIRSGLLFSNLGVDPLMFDKSRDRIMICGGPAFNNEIRDMLESVGWMHGTMRSPGDFVQERAFVETIE
jgi:ferredoxin--NADP+ reductase